MEIIQLIKKSILFFCFAFLSSIIITPVHAVESLNHLNPVADTPPSPDISTREETDRTVREYRINGQLYAIEIIPKNGAPYFLVDNKGDGNFVRAPNDTRRIAIPQWTLIRW